MNVEHTMSLVVIPFQYKGVKLWADLRVDWHNQGVDVHIWDAEYEKNLLVLQDPHFGKGIVAEMEMELANLMERVEQYSTPIIK